MTDKILYNGGDIDRPTRAYTIHEKNSVDGDLIVLGGGNEIMAEEVEPGVGETVEYVGWYIDRPVRVIDRINPSGSGKAHILQNLVIVGILVQEAVEIVIRDHGQIEEASDSVRTKGNVLPANQDHIPRPIVMCSSLLT